MRVLITGACGLLGAHLMAGLGNRHEVTGIDRHPWWGDEPADLRLGDLSESGFVRQVFSDSRPEVVIHCAAMADVDACEKNPQAAFFANADLTARLAAEASPEALFIYISTDGIFEGTRALAGEGDPPAPPTVYGQSKLRGEEEAQKRSPRHLILRTNFYGWSSGRKKTFAEWLHRAFEEKQPITLFEDFFFTPLYVVDFVERVKLLMEKGTTGVMHLAGRDRVSKSQFGFRLAELAGFSSEAVKVGSLHQAHWIAPRPGDMSLRCERWGQITGQPLPGMEDGLRRFLEDRAKSLSRRCRAPEEAAR